MEGEAQGPTPPPLSGPPVPRDSAEPLRESQTPRDAALEATSSLAESDKPDDEQQQTAADGVGQPAWRCARLGKIRRRRRLGIGLGRVRRALRLEDSKPGA